MSRCPRCGVAGTKVRRITPKALVTAAALRRLDRGDYFFCPAPDCDAVYFVSDGRPVFTKHDLTVRVGLKEREDPVPICYCFGFTESHIRDDLARRGDSDIPEEIARQVRAGRCACEVRNPEGICCLRRVARTTQLFAAAAGDPLRYRSRNLRTEP